MHKRISTFKEFYQFYLSEHSHSLNRGLHFIGTTLVLLLLVLFIVTLNYIFLVAIPFAGYGFAWIGHFFIEKNKPATFKYPFWSFISDFIPIEYRNALKENGIYFP